MQTPAIIFSCVLVAAASGATTSLLLRSDAPLAPATTALEGQVAELRQELAALRQQQSAADRAQPAVSTVPATVSRTEVPQVSEAQIAAAVAAYMRKQSVAPSGAAAEFDLDADFDKLADADYWENPEMWKRAFAAGRMDEVIAKYEALAKADPKNPAAQMQLAKACIAYLQMDPSKWQLSMKADKAYDNVLDLDENHWEARFSKAVSYTFWPDFMGKKKPAIEHFEILVKQQELQPVADHQAQTYLFLGNLLEQSDPARAKEVWQRGAQRHPNNTALRERLAQ